MLPAPSQLHKNLNTGAVDLTSKIGSLFLLIAITIMFTAGLIYASLELPGLINMWLMEAFDFPGVDSSIESSVTEAFIQSNHIRLIGFGCFAGVIALIVIGFITEKHHLASLGAFAFFLPVFGHFALNMFFLAGLGILRVIWMPVLDASYNLLDLGDIVYVPYMLLVYFPALAGIDVRPFVIYFFITSGLFLYVLGVFTWLYFHTHRTGIVDWGIYRFSRHPQYLGWIVWSYGMMLLISRLRPPRIMYSLGNSLPWLISTIVIIGVAMVEEIKMNQYIEYQDYRSRTPFLLPLPPYISLLISLPYRLVFRNNFSGNGSEVLMVLCLYTCILVLLSVPFVVFHWPPDTGWFRFPFNIPPFSYD